MGGKTAFDGGALGLIPPVEKNAPGRRAAKSRGSRTFQRESRPRPRCRCEVAQIGRLIFNKAGGRVSTLDIQGMTENLMLEGWADDEYQAFVDKFKTKKTTDDCYTPPNVYDAVADWVASEYHLDKSRFLRPFYPGGDYERFDYPASSPVVDNPPFSILSKIIGFYARHRISFFLFAPALTLFSSSSSSSSATCIPCGVQITYENGAKVPTSFVTNLDDRTVRVRTAPSLYRAVKAADNANRAMAAKALPRYEYPENIITAAMVQRWCKYGVEYSLSVEESLPIDALEAQKKRGLSIFGNGFILGTSAAAERAAAERAAAERAAAEKWTLSTAELEIVKYIDERTERSCGQKLDADKSI